MMCTVLYQAQLYHTPLLWTGERTGVVDACADVEFNHVFQKAVMVNNDYVVGNIDAIETQGRIET